MSVSISQHVDTGHRALQCTSQNSHIWPNPTLKAGASNCRAQLVIVFELSAFSYIRRMKSCTVPCTDSAVLWNDFHELRPTQTASDVLPETSVRPLFSVSVWSGRNSWLTPYNNIAADWLTLREVGYYTVHVSGRGVPESTAVNGLFTK